jgi:hypothetical protein
MMAATATHFSRPFVDAGGASHPRVPLGLGFDLKMKAPVYADDPVTVGWRVTEVRWHAALQGWITRLEGQATSRRSGVVLEGKGTLLVTPTPPQGDIRAAV